MSDFNRERLGKIVAIARRGAPGEKENAIAIVKKICAAHKLDFDTVMGSDEVLSEYVLSYKTKEQARVLAQVIARFAYDGIAGQLYGNEMRKVFIVNTTKERYIETLNAWEVLWDLYAKESKKMKEIYFHGFLEKHNLYATPTEDYSGRTIDEEEMKIRDAGSALTRHMQSADLHRRLTDGHG